MLIASDLPLQGEDGPAPRAMADAIRAVLAEHGSRAGKYAVGYRSCDDSTEQAGTYEPRRCAANANAYAGAERLVAVIGPWNSGCAQVEIPILNRAPGGPLADDQPHEPRRRAHARRPAAAVRRTAGRPRSSTRSAPATTSG